MSVKTGEDHNMGVGYYKNSLSFLRFGFVTSSLAKSAKLKEKAQ